MKISPAIELFLVLTGVVLTIPAVYEDFKDEFPTGDWETWMKLSPHIIYTTAVSIGMLGYFYSTSCMLIIGWIGMILGLACTYYLALFNTRAFT